MALLTKNGRIRPTVRAIVYLPAVLVGTVTLTGLVLSILGALIGAPMSALQPTGGGPLEVAFYLTYLIAVLLVTLAFRRGLDGRSLTSLGFETDAGWVKELVVGLVLGVGLMAIIFGVELALGAYTVSGFAWTSHSWGEIVPLLLYGLLAFVVVAINEELITRGYLLQNLEADWGTAVALVASSGIFALMHILNEGADIAAMLGILAAGLLLGTGYLVTRRLWLPIGLHLTWNYAQGPIFGFQVSGNTTGGLIETVAAGPAWLTGGAFGPEAGAVAIVVELLAIGLLVWLGQMGWLGAERREIVKREPVSERA